MKFSITKNSAVPLTMFFASLLLYAATLHPSIFPSDPTEFMTVIGVNGVAHPPGYPLFTLLGKLASFFPFLTFPERINFLSAFFGAATVGLASHIIMRLSKSIPAAALGAGALALAKSFWLYSVTAEVFTLNTFLLALFANQIISFIQKPSQKNGLLSVFALSISAGNHHTAAFMLPALIYILLKKRRAAGLKWNFIPLAFFVSLAGLLPYIYVVIAARGNPPINWDNAANLKNLIRLFLRQDFGTTALAAGELAYRPKTTALEFFLKNAVTETFGLLPLFAAAGAILFIRRKQTALAMPLIWGFLALGPFFMMISRLPIASLNQAAAIERFFMAPSLFLAILAGYGAAGIFGYLRRRLKLVSPIIILILLAPLAAANISYAGQKNNFLYYKYSVALLNGLPKNAVFLTTDDISDNGAHYLQFVENIRPDVKLVTMPKVVADWYRESLGELYPELRDLLSANPAEAVKNLCRTYAKDGLIFSAGWPRQFTGAEEECLPLPFGLLTRLTPPNAQFNLEDYQKTQTDFFDKFLSEIPASDKRPRDNRTERLIYEISAALDAVADTLKRQGNEDAAILFYQRATITSPYWYRSLNKLAAIDVKNEMLDEAIAKTRESIKRNPDFPWSYYDLGIMLFGVGDAKGAEGALDYFISFETNAQSPQVEMAKQALAQIRAQK
ncbi:DUF2723 domain-containing protein [Candidatus Uhrbacteria bacterium]|nr:DUF2723 domain-containing protein [Candidatus Uhrbacteria bacterium]